MHERLLQIVHRLDSDYEPFGRVEKNGSDCSFGCRHFVRLANEVRNDWGVCTNSESPRAGLLTFEHQGCSTFEPITVNRSFSDSQLRNLISEASQILHDRRQEGIAEGEGATTIPVEHGEFIYEVRTSYFPKIKGHFPVVFRLEYHDGGFAAIPLEAKVSGKERPTVKGRFPARNGDVFKIVRENGDYSYQVPFSGVLYNLKQRGDLSRIGLGQIESLRPLFERMEPELFQEILTDATGGVGRAKRWLEESRDRLDRWQRKEFWADEAPRSKRELREMLDDEKKSVAEGPNRIVEQEAFVEWLNGIERSKTTLESFPCPPPPKMRSR